MRVSKALLRALIFNACRKNLERGIQALKRHGFSRADVRYKWISALAAEGKLSAQENVLQGLKPRSFFATLAARLKSCPFKTRRLTPRTRGFMAWIAGLLLVTCAVSSAQSPTAHDLAQRVDHHYNQLHSLKSGFTESYEGLGMQRTESGTLLLLKPGRMRWDYSSPAGKLFLLDGKYAWFYSQGDPQVQRIAAKQLDDLRSPLRFLLGHTELEKEMDTLTLAPASAGRYTLSGQPKGQEKHVSRLSLTVTADGTITGIEIEESDGALTRFIFTGEVPNAPIPAEQFHFTPPPGVPVVDAVSPV
jgi:outer membrane lipoprotein carrier protein